MELDFRTVKALSSKTRLKILNHTITNESTPTDISDAIGKSKSTVSSHLSQLQEAGLVEKEDEDGRRRVIYRPTSKTEAILKGRDRKVKFSVLSSVSTAWIGLGMMIGGYSRFQDRGTGRSGEGIGTMTVEPQTASEAAGALSGFQPVDVLLFAGAGFLSVSLAGIIYGFMVSRLRN